MKIGYFVAILFIVVTSGCAPSMPSGSEHNKTQANTQIDADEAYVAFRTSHENSPKIPSMIISLIKSHTAAGEYKLAEFYCNEYRRDFPSGKRRDEVEYLSIKALYLNNKQHFDERLVEQIRAQGKFFVQTFAKSQYKPKVKQIMENIEKEQNARYEALAKEYEKRGKPKAAEFYRKKIRK